MKNQKKVKQAGGEKQFGHYHAKRKLRLVPLGYSDECRALCEAISEGRSRAKEQRAFMERCARDLGGPLWA